ncbi:PKD domain-containing protein [Flavivirga eckloniae]|nr:hypothetical protein [Flavivirga eckloniae]
METKRITHMFFTILCFTLLTVSCDKEISYDEYSEAPIIENATLEITIDDHISRAVSIVATAEGNDYFEISWGDGITTQSTTGIESYNYVDAGNYTIKSVARKDGLVNQAVNKSVSVGLISNLTINSNVDPNDTDTVTLTLSALNATNYDIDWGDGTAVENTTTSTAVHTYAENGDYIVIVTAKATGFADISAQTQVSIVGTFVVVLNQDFETGDLSDWTESYPGALSIIEDPTNPANKVLKYDSTVSAGWDSNNRNFPETPDNVVVTFEFNYFTDNPTGWSDYIVLDSEAGKDVTGSTAFQHSGTVGSYRMRVEGGGVGEAFAPLSLNEWHAIKVVIDPIAETTTYTFDGNPGSAVVLNNLATAPYHNFDRIRFGHNGNNDYYLDNIKVSYVE